MSTDSNDMTETILNYIEENRVRLEAEGADVPDRLRESAPRILTLNLAEFLLCAA